MKQKNFFMAMLTALFYSCEIHKDIDNAINNYQNEVQQTPKADFSYEHGVSAYWIQFTNQSVGLHNFQWEFGDGNSTEVYIESPMHIYKILFL